MAAFDFAPDPRLTLKIAETREELEACFRLLHDAYVESGYMRPHPSGMRVTAYHALPTTTTLCAQYDGEVIGTISLIRDGVFGFPVQQAFDLHDLRQQSGQIAEASALAVSPEFRMHGGLAVFPLMKFMYEYCTKYFDTRHLVIAVHPKHIKFYESVLFVQRLQEKVVERYDFVNGAPAVAGSVDLYYAADLMRKAYAGKPRHRDLAAYFLDLDLPNIQWPSRRYHITNDPVMTPELLDYFFNQRTATFQQMDRRQIALIHSIYRSPEYQTCLPPLTREEQIEALARRHPRYTLHCPATLTIEQPPLSNAIKLDVVDVSMEGFQAEAAAPVPLETWGQVEVELGRERNSKLSAVAVRQQESGGHRYVGFRLSLPDRAWRAFIQSLERGQAHKTRPQNPSSGFFSDSVLPT
jgi:hypothetical protein